MKFRDFLNEELKIKTHIKSKDGFEFLISDGAIIKTDLLKNIVYAISKQGKEIDDNDVKKYKKIIG